MKRIASSLILVLVMATGLTAASPVSAQEITRTVTITRDSKVAGQALIKGEYSIKFVDGKDGDLVLLKGKKEVVKVAYKVSKLAQAPADSSVAYATASDGTFQVKRIEFKGKTEALVLD